MAARSQATRNRDDSNPGAGPRRQEGQGALVTGAGKGLGRALALALARQGARVVLVARTRSDLQEVQRAIEREGGEAHALVADVGVPEAMVALAAEAQALVGRIDLLVHAASTLGPLPLPLLSDTEPHDLERVLQVQVVGPQQLTRSLLAPMLLRGSGTVVGITSDAGVTAYPGWGAYGVAKAAFEHLLRIWAAEVQDTGVRFVTVDPGEMDTQMHADAMPEADRAQLADPADVAVRLLHLLADPGTRNGDRVDASQPPPAQPRHGVAKGVA